MSGDQANCVLVVDDDPDICDAFQMVLESYGYRVVTADSGVDALDKLRAGTKPCLILLDVMMPLMNGFQFRSEQVRDPVLASIPVVLVSAGGDVAAKAAAMGVVGLKKPVDLDVLLETVARFGCVPANRNDDREPRPAE